MLRIAGCRQPAIRVRAAFLHTPVATRVEHRDAALACLMAEFRDCTTRMRTSMSGRSPQDASEHVVQNRMHAEKRQRETVRDANRRARFGKIQELALRTLKRKTPG